MDNRQLLYFKTVCEEGGFTKASEKLYISPQGISKAIHKLEDELGVPLFETTPIGVMLTEYGVALKSHVAPYLTQHNYIMDHMSSMRNRLNYQLYIGVQSGFCDLLPKGFFSDFITGNPDIHTSIKSFDDDAMAQNMNDSSIKIWFCSGTYDKDLFDVLFERRQELFLIAGETHPLAKKKSVRMSDLIGIPLINIASDLGHQSKLKLNMSKVGVAPQYLLNPADRTLTMELVARGIAVSFHGGSFYKNFPGIVRIEIEDLNVEFSEGIIIRKDTYKTDAIKRFVEYVERLLEKENDTGVKASR